MAEAVRRTIITIATERGIDVIATNSIGDATRRADLLARLGPGATEQILDPGFDVITEAVIQPGWHHVGAMR